ncbi:hypothetical protein PM085_18005 [Halorubrum ezzemoulense]|uniref:Glycosyl transferase family 1 domain-containing protein n=1 Tax=Halorubrum ezzemoulense TaxID=337243 RepID=A0ABT4Z7Q3_HALEZ|nr:hypothetical protein [Halorubrum ezzemoulense]MDB2294119.1 hypothetical protein [Halorubrum ezzemoulense]
MSEFRIGILNLSSHENYVRSVAEIAVELGPVSIFTTSSIYERVGGSSAFDVPPDEWDLKGHSESKREYLARVEQRASEHIDILISFPFYGHVFDYTAYVNFEPDCEYLLYSFDINSMLGRNPTFIPKIYNYLKYPMKKAILQRVDRLLVEFSPIAEYVSSTNSSVDVETFTPILSNSVESDSSKDKHNQQERDSLTVTIPGMIDSTRRNYDEVLEALNALSQERKEEIELVLLGKPVGDYGSTVIQRAKSLENEGVKLEYYTDWIPTDTFAKKLNSTDLLVSPLCRQRPIDGFVEEYGKSKGSGAISDAISYATPLLFPSWFEVPELAEPGIHTYRDEADLQEMFTELLNDSDYRREWFNGAQEMARRYSKSKQKERLQRIVDKTKSDSND